MKCRKPTIGHSFLWSIAAKDSFLTSLTDKVLCQNSNPKEFFNKFILLFVICISVELLTGISRRRIFY